MSVEIIQAGEWTPAEAAEYVSEPWQNAVESIVETGRRLIEAKQRVGHGKWGTTVELLPFSDRAAQRLILIARHPDLSNTTHGSYLPPSWRTLATLAQLPEGEIPRRIETGEITPELERRRAEEIAAEYQAAQQEELNQWSNFVDGLTLALSQAQLFHEAPVVPDNYVDLREVRSRLDSLVEIVDRWEMM